jgi:hypothetical protein
MYVCVSWTYSLTDKHTYTHRKEKEVAAVEAKRQKDMKEAERKEAERRKKEEAARKEAEKQAAIARAKLEAEERARVSVCVCVCGMLWGVLDEVEAGYCC